MKKQLIILLTLVLFVFCSCTKTQLPGDPVTKNFDVTSSYVTLDVRDAFDVTVCDTVSQVIVTIGENIMPKVVVEVVNKTLKIYLKPFYTISTGEAKVILPYNPDLKEIGMSGAATFRSEFPMVCDKANVVLTGASDCYCDIEADEVDMDLSGASDFYGDIAANEMDLELSGSSNIEGNVSATELDLDLSGASDAKLVGQVDKLKINLSGSSNIVKRVIGNKYGLVCDKCEGKMSGSSDAYIHCDGSIRVSLSGASDLHYTGNANTTGSDTSGASNIYHDVLP